LLTRVEAIQLLKQMEDCSLISVHFRQSFTKKLIGPADESDGALALINAFHHEPITLADELGAFCEPAPAPEPAAAPLARTKSAIRLRDSPPPAARVHFAADADVPVPKASRAKKRRSRKPKAPAPSLASFAPAVAVAAASESAANKAFEERLRKIREGV
jgi:hypothetical protein